MNRAHKPNEHLTAAQVRHKLEQAVEAAIAALDAFDGDPDIESCCDDDENTGDDEHSNGDGAGLEFDVVDFGDMNWPEQIDQTPKHQWY